MLDKFIVTDSNDGKVLRRLRQENNCGHTCGVLNVKAAPRYRIPGGPQVEGVDLVADVFSIENDVVFNALVDHCVRYSAKCKSILRMIPYRFFRKLID